MDWAWVRVARHEDPRPLVHVEAVLLLPFLPDLGRIFFAGRSGDEDLTEHYSAAKYPDDSDLEEGPDDHPTVPEEEDHRHERVDLVAAEDRLNR